MSSAISASDRARLRAAQRGASAGGRLRRPWRGRSRASVSTRFRNTGFPIR